MYPYSRGNRLLNLSLQKTECESKRRKLCKSPVRRQTPGKAHSILDISTSQLIELPDELDLSISSNDISFVDLPPLSSAIKVANFIMHEWPDQPYSTGESSSGQKPCLGKGVDELNASESGEIIESVVSEMFEGKNVEESGVVTEVVGTKGVNVEKPGGITEVMQGVNVKESWGVVEDVNVKESEVVTEGMQGVNVEESDGVVEGVNVKESEVVTDVMQGVNVEESDGVVEGVNVESSSVVGDVNVKVSEVVTEVMQGVNVEESEGVVDGVNVKESEVVTDVMQGVNVEESDGVVEGVNVESSSVVGDVNVKVPEVVTEVMQGVNVEESDSVVEDVNVKESGAEVVTEEVEGVGVESGELAARDMSQVEGASNIDGLQVNEENGGHGSSSRSNTATNFTKKEEQKRKRQFGLEYVGRYFDKDAKKFVEVNKEEKSLGPRCVCKASYYSCKEVSDADREKIHEKVWSMSWDEKKVFVRMAVDVKDVKERKSVSDVHKRNNTLVFNLKSGGARMRVCKEMFLNTTGMKKWWVLNTVTEDVPANPKDTLERRQVADGLNFVKEFLGRLPKMPSHYCRKDTKKLYLEPLFQSYADIYREYLKICEEEGKQKMSRTVFVAEIKACDISIFVPRKDQCDLCCEYAQGNAEESLYNRHRERKEAAQREKAQDKESYPLTSRTKLLCVDVQRVLLSPSLKASALYYKTKLQVHNYTVFNMASKDAVCYIWNEVEGGLNASEFASCLVSYLEDTAESFDKAIIYSDGCTYQNRNRVLATALRYFCLKHGKTIEQKILELGHTQMEVDSVHATIERRLKNMDVYSPLDYVNLIKISRSTPSPYQVKYLTFDFFKDFDKYEEAIKSIKPSKTKNVTNICALKYSGDGSLSFKLNFSDHWEVLPLGRKDQLPTTDPHRLHKCKRKIKKTKFDHLQLLKTVLPADVHHFYDTLPHQ